jgi:rod shape-determining protein MreC
MRNLLVFLGKYRFVFLFVLLETIAIGMVTTSYSYHRSLVFNTVNDLTGNIFETYSGITDYIGLKEENKILTEENAQLRNQLNSSFSVTDTNAVYVDTLYRYIPAHVVYITVTKPANYFIVNKGKKHGIKKEMGVISPLGIAGIVIGVSEHYSLVMSLLHHNFTGSAFLKKSGMLVNVVWDGEDYRFGKILDIPSHLDLQKGDTVVTTGFSTIFPEGLPVGYVEAYTSAPEKEFAEGKIRFATNYKTMKNVYIIENIQKPEIEELLNHKDE